MFRPVRLLTNRALDEQHGEFVDAKDITNTYRSRAPFPFLFNSDDPKQPKVSIASISQPDHDAMMRLINAGRITASRVNESSTTGTRTTVTPIEPDRDSMSSPVDTKIPIGKLEYNQRATLSRRASSTVDEGSSQFQIPPTLPAFSTILSNETPFSFPQLQSSSLQTTLPTLPRPRSVDSLPPITSYSSAMVIDPPLESPRSSRWSRIYNDISRLGSGVVQWSKDIEALRIQIEELSRGESESSKQTSQVLKEELEQIRAENSALQLQVKHLTEENQKVICERDVLKNLLLERMSQAT
ncbi:hypothetical protein H072_7079 [Dactylellina haptotyla CBS 200.50]|uniref:Uncharacterized protein n=1 Tax=Dactylellina haptotyla (strain CBS 200.50) TaxID=1284197 RepID=S8BIK1_DACHA|nr:hypothetical protein H072_7079 [Dactylellina haptotyla CBS 200.50]